ncbi:SHOCT domain-containing protein [bacterium]|nr:SHOCT domain-containing protein [bacterium]|tara:strand:- start:152 stop:373 length:222 start_codon:yes stop_codon:yes gene_type:complete
MHFYEGYHFGGMHLFWWIIWVVIIFWVFAIPDDIPWQRKKNAPIDILKKRLAAGVIDSQEFEERKKVLINKNN